MKEISEQRQLSIRNKLMSSFFWRNNGVVSHKGMRAMSINRIKNHKFLDKQILEYTLVDNMSNLLRLTSMCFLS